MLLTVDKYKRYHSMDFDNWCRKDSNGWINSNVRYTSVLEFVLKREAPLSNMNESSPPSGRPFSLNIKANEWFHHPWFSPLIQSTGSKLRLA